MLICLEEKGDIIYILDTDDYVVEPIGREEVEQIKNKGIAIMFYTSKVKHITYAEYKYKDELLFIFSHVWNKKANYYPIYVFYKKEYMGYIKVNKRPKAPNVIINCGYGVCILIWHVTLEEVVQIKLFIQKNDIEIITDENFPHEESYYDVTFNYKSVWSNVVKIDKVDLKDETNSIDVEVQDKHTWGITKADITWKDDGVLIAFDFNIHTNAQDEIITIRPNTPSFVFLSTKIQQGLSELLYTDKTKSYTNGYIQGLLKYRLKRQNYCTEISDLYDWLGRYFNAKHVYMSIDTGSITIHCVYLNTKCRCFVNKSSVFQSLHIAQESGTDIGFKLQGRNLLGNSVTDYFLESINDTQLHFATDKTVMILPYSYLFMTED